MIFWKAALLALATLTACTDQKPPPQAVASEPAVEASPRPAIWKISDVDTTVYLFGTVHVLPPTLTWHSPALDKALEESKAVYFETDVEGDPMVFRDIIQRLGLYQPSEKLSDRLAPADLELLKSTLAKLELPLVAIESMRPWYAGVVISEAVVRRAGYDVTSGVESVIRPAASAAGKQIRFLETIQQQMASFATLPEPVQIKFLTSGLAEMDTATDDLNALVNAWKAGDTDGLNKLLIEDDLGAIPEVYDALLKNRNANWAPEIDTLMKSETGTFLVAVGAAHLIGKDSVIEMLKPMGHAAERVQ
ncbi:MAG TPA: TraB/GumN family protein [Hyphomonadaceae bacterium]|nr:TraB/GumN family protein [Hyphomonadaceae bacterium]HPN07225.1 TraB/GumN family protein [Hyphomonadaceae bacterium]